MSNWLDRLRQVKGFPSDDEGRGLDHFLALQQQQQQLNGDDHLIRRIRRRAATPATAASPSEADVSNRMASMLSDLFSDRGSNRILNSKAPRKQSCPKICVVPNENNNNNNSINGVLVEGRKGKAVRRDRLEREKARKKPEDSNLAGFSRTEVTIIDSSCPLWKFDKYLFRKKNVWKARDRRGTAAGYSVVAKKKREGLAAAVAANDDDDDDDGDGDGDGIVGKKDMHLLFVFPGRQ
uniref:Uncharacterized protein n=1 Tax=Kalanchoe fedtschenkoi TaxID=63787 RepID=A0A7N0TGD9_KALFE